MRRFVRLLILALLVGTAWSCTETLVDIIDIAQLRVEPTAATLYVGENVALEAHLEDDRGNTLSGRELQWSSDDPDIATVNAQGVVHGESAGFTDIVATSEGVRAAARITVHDRPVIHIEPDSAAITLVRGDAPQPTTLAITNTGGSELAGLTVQTEYETGASGWLSAVLSAATAPAMLTLTPQPGVLAPGTYRAIVRVSAPEASNTPVIVRVRLDFLRQTAADIAVAGGDGQTAVAGTIIATPIGVVVTDANGSPIEGLAVTFAVASGGGSLAIDAPVLTNTNGIALAPPWTLGMVAGTNTLSARVEGLSADSVIFTATGIPGPPSQLTMTTEPSASAPGGSPFARQPVIQVRDALGNAVRAADIAVTATIASGGGQLAGTTSVQTDSAGVARFTDLAVVGSVGERRLRFIADGLTSVTSSAIAITTGAGTRLSLATQPSSGAQSGVTFAQQPAVQLLDDASNPVAQTGVLVTVTIGSGGGTLGGTTTATTDLSGVARFTDLRITGPAGERTLAFSASGISAATSNPITLAAGPPSAAHSSAVVPNATAGSTTPITITLRDSGTNPVTGAAALIAVSITGANTASPAVTDNGDGTYGTSYRPTAIGTDQVAITLGGTPIAGSPFTSTITPSGVDVSNSSVTVAPDRDIIADGADAAAVTVMLRDSIGNPVSGLAGSIEVGLNGIATAAPVAETPTPGTYMFNVTSIVANVVSIAVTVGGATLPDKPTVDFVPGAVAVGSSTIGATTGVLADGMAESIVTISLADAFGNPITGFTEPGNISIVLSSTTAQRSALTNNGDGTYTFTITNAVAEEVTVTVTAGGVALAPATIQFIAGSVDTGASTAVASPTTNVKADGVTASTVTVTLFDGNGNTITGATVTATSTGEATVGTVSETGNGVYTFAVTDTTAETVTLTVVANGTTLLNPPSIAFVAGDPSGSRSTAVANPTSGVTADTVAFSTVTVTVVDGQGNAISGIGAAEFVVTGTATTKISAVSESGGGVYTFTVRNSTAETVNLTISVRTVAIANPPSIGFVAGPVEAANSSVNATSPVVVTSGSN